MQTAWATMGLRWRLSLYLGAALALLLVAFALLSLRSVNQAQSQAFSQQLRLTSAIAGGMEREFDHVSADAHTYLPGVPSPATTAEVLAAFQEHLAELENLGYFRVSSIRLVSVDGEVLGAAPLGTPVLPETLPPLEIIHEAVSKGATLVSPSRVPPGDETPFGAIVVPIQASAGSSQGAALVVETVGLASISLFSSTKEAASEPDAETQGNERPYEVEVLGPRGAVLATSEGAGDLGTISYHYDAMREFFERGEAGAIVHRPGGGHPDHIAAVVPLEKAPFFLVTEEPLGLLLDWPQQLRTQTIILGSIAAVIILALGWIVGQQIVRPLIALRSATARIKGGDLETPVRVQARDELTQLAEEVEEMRQRLQDTVSSLDSLNRSLADQVGERTQQLRAVVGRLMQAQEEERRRVARDLHDETAQGLTALGVILDEAVLNAGQSGKEDLNSIRAAREQVNRLVADTRRLAYALRPSVLDDVGLVPALRWCAEAYLESGGIHVSIEASGPEERFPEPVEVALFRVGQEAMSNVARHAQASHAWVTLERTGAWATLTVRDDGVGFDARRTMRESGQPTAHGLGLAGMRERVDLLGGRLHVYSQLGAGTTVTAHVPTEGWDEERP